jgi:integrase
MARTLNRLNARLVASLDKPGRHADGGNLYLSISTGGAKSWTFMTTFAAKRIELGLGPLSSVPLAEARKRAALARAAIERGEHPRQALRPVSMIPTFGAMADELIAAMEGSWRNEKHAAQWRMTLKEYCRSIRSMAVDQITTEHVLSVLKPLWASRPETASRLRGRIEAVIAAATAKNHRSGPNPAAWRNHLDRLLPARQRLTRGHHKALAYSELPAFIARLRSASGISALALEYLILTAARSGEVLGCRWDEIDMGAKVWTVPAGRMKSGREHRSPLSDRALAILAEVQPLRRQDGFVFPGVRPGKSLSSMSLAMLLRRLQPGTTVHGFRSSFRDWAGEETGFARDVAEAALAHVVGDQTERAYRRADALEKRRKLMAAWASYIEPSEAKANVVRLR